MHNTHTTQIVGTPSVIEAEFYPSNQPTYEELLSRFDQLSPECLPIPGGIILGDYDQSRALRDSVLWVTSDPWEFWSLSTRRRVEPPERFLQIFPELGVEVTDKHAIANELIEGETVSVNMPWYDDVLGLFDRVTADFPESGEIVVGVYQKYGKLVPKILWVSDAPRQFWCTQDRKQKEIPMRYHSIFSEASLLEEDSE